jgi:hypothetical protein
VTLSVYTIAGTGHPGAAGAVNDGKGGFPAQVADLLDKSKITVKPVAYPASVPFYTSVASGASTLDGMLASETGDFSIVAYSQGAMVASAIYDQLRGATLASKRAQLKGAVMLGNPRREEGRLFPGGTAVAGHGIQDAATRLTDTEDLWWEMSIPGCLASAVGDTPDDLQLTRVFMSLAVPPKGIPAGVQALRNLIVEGPALLGDLMTVPQYAVGNGSTGVFPHGQYGTHCPIGGDPRTCVQVAADYINSLA